MLKKGRLQFAGVELYFEDLPKAMKFYAETLGLELSQERLGHHARFNSDGGFICLERKGVESFPSQDKALIFFEVADLEVAINAIGPEKILQSEANWAVLHDPEGHNILLLQKSK
jgi:predicted enzyme related to lactoylglutathione lyase